MPSEPKPVLTKREEVATRILAALLANPVALSAYEEPERAIDHVLTITDQFLARLAGKNKDTMRDK